MHVTGSFNYLAGTNNKIQKCIPEEKDRGPWREPERTGTKGGPYHWDPTTEDPKGDLITEDLQEDPFTKDPKDNPITKDSKENLKKKPYHWSHDLD